jgi:hypothetical protein
MKQTLKGIICLVLTAFTILVSLGNQVQAAETTEYAVNQYQIVVILQADGSALVTETISYQLLKRVKQFNFTINYVDAGRIRLDKIDVSTQADQASAPVFVEVLHANAASNQLQPLTYEVKDNGSNLQIQLNALSESDTRRTVRLTYQLTHSVMRQQNAALLKWRFFASSGAVDISKPSLAIQLPQAVSPLQTWYLPVSLAEFIMTQPQKNQLVFQAAQMLSDQDLTLYCLLSTDMFPDAATAENSQSWEAITEEARQLESGLHRQASMLSALTAFLYILLGLAVLVVLLIFWIFDKESAAKFRQKYLLEIPTDCSPALMAILLHRARPGRLILGTLLDLVRRGELSLHGCIFTWLNPERQDYTGFSASEVFLMQWLFGHVSSGMILSTAEIRRFAREPATAHEFQAYYQQYRQLLDEEVVSQGLIDTKLTRKGRLVSWLAALVYLILAILATIGLRSFVGLHLLIPTIILTVYSLQIRRLTVTGRELYARCLALLRTIRHYSHLREQTDNHFAGTLLPIAVSLGIADPWLNRLVAEVPDRRLPVSDLFREYGLNSTTKSWPDQVRALSADLKVMESMLSASLLMASGIHW